VLQAWLANRVFRFTREHRRPRSNQTLRVESRADGLVQSAGVAGSHPGSAARASGRIKCATLLLGGVLDPMLSTSASATSPSPSATRKSAQSS